MEQLIGNLPQYGLLGILLAIALLAIYFLYKEIKLIQEKRIQDLKDVNSQVVEPLSSTKRTVETILSILTNRKGR